MQPISIRSLLAIFLAAVVAVAISAENPFTAFCARNAALCDEINTHGFTSRHDMVPDVARAFWRTTIESSFLTILSAADARHQTTKQEKQHLLSALMNSGLFKKWQQRTTKANKGDVAWVDNVEHRDTDELRRIVEQAGLAGSDKEENGAGKKYPYWGFVPMYITAAPLGQPSFVTAGGCAAGTVVISSLPATRCSTSTIVTAQCHIAGKSVSIAVNSTGAGLSLFCMDHYHFTIGPAHVEAPIDKAGIHRFSINITALLADPALTWDLAEKGLRVFLNAKNEVARTLDIIDTLMLFLPMITNKLDPVSAAKNMFYFNEYTKIQPPVTWRAYNQSNVLPIPEQWIRSGDLIAKSELDGLGPSEGLGQVTAAGHVAIAMRTEATNELLICEAITIGITCTPFRPWAEALHASGMATVWVPLRKDYSANFNLSSAWSWVNKTLGNAYSYETFLLSWIDNAGYPGNFPRFPPDFVSRGLTAEALELFFWNLNAVAPMAVNFFMGQALNHRVGTWNSNGGLGFAETLQAAGEKSKAAGKPVSNASFANLLTIPEQDDWLYNTTRRGTKGSLLLPAQVCSTFAMNVLRHGGVFDTTSRNFYAAEQDCWDVYSLAIFDDTQIGENRPSICKQADPANPLCQLTGGFTFYLQTSQNGGFNSRRPFSYMGIRCMSQNPAPANRNGCFAGPTQK